MKNNNLELFYRTLFYLSNPKLSSFDLDLLSQVAMDNNPFQLESIQDSRKNEFRKHFIFSAQYIISEIPTEYFKGLFYNLMITNEFNNLSKNKMVVLSAFTSENKIYTLHHNVLINDFTTFYIYWKEIQEEIYEFLENYIALVPKHWYQSIGRITLPRLLHSKH